MSYFEPGKQNQQTRHNSFYFTFPSFIACRKFSFTRRKKQLRLGRKGLWEIKRNGRKRKQHVKSRKLGVKEKKKKAFIR